MNKIQTLELLGGGPVNCGGGSCPAVYRDTNGKIFIQGDRLSEDGANGIVIDQRESVVEITPEMLEVLKSL